MSLDETYENLNVKLQTKLLLTAIIEAYNGEIWDLKVIYFLFKHQFGVF